MVELSFLTIIVSLAVGALLVYAVFQYMKVRLTILEHSHKEQAMILQQFIEESSTDIHRLYQISSSSTNGGSVATNGSIILEYANDKPVAYNEPHMIHLDTALFQNKRNSNLIEISSDSEDTTDESEEHENSSDDDHSESSDEDNDSASSDSGESQADDCAGAGASGAGAANCESAVVNDDECNHDQIISEIVSSPEIKLITVDLGITPESEIKFHMNVEEKPIEPPALSQGTHVSSPSIPLTSMSVPDLKHLLKDKYKTNPEKHAEIQKLKKAELIYALQHSQ
jgi:hypothetical protein